MRHEFDRLTSASAIERLRVSTKTQHERLEARLDAIERFADADRREELVRRFATFHLSMDEALEPTLRDVEGLDFERRRRTPLLAAFAGPLPAPSYPPPATLGEALGMLYVSEGSSLGGRVILRELARRGVADRSLDFLDPYGAETGLRWRQFMTVLARETVDGIALDDAEAGAIRGFAHAETTLCGVAR